jgi:hypothetical protein
MDGSTAPDKLLIAINYTEQKLTVEQVKELQSDTGLKVEAPSSKQNYYLYHKGNEAPKAILKGADAAGDPNDEKHLMRTAATMMNMIDNIAAKGGIVHVKTKDPFLARIASQYIQYLKEEKGVQFAETSVNSKPVTLERSADCSLEDAGKMVKADEIFGKMKTSLNADITATQPKQAEVKEDMFSKMKRMAEEARKAAAAKDSEATDPEVDEDTELNSSASL